MASKVFGAKKKQFHFPVTDLGHQLLLEPVSLAVKWANVIGERKDIRSLPNMSSLSSQFPGSKQP